MRFPENWCLSENNRMVKAGDFNGDKFTDLLCHNASGIMKVLINQGGNVDLMLT